jgi:hypothetical protein
LRDEASVDDGVVVVDVGGGRSRGHRKRGMAAHLNG